MNQIVLIGTACFLLLMGIYLSGQYAPVTIITASIIGLTTWYINHKEEKVLNDEKNKKIDKRTSAHSTS